MSKALRQGMWLCGLAWMATGAHASEGEAAAFSVFGAQKFWFATFEANSVDVQTVIPPGSTAPVVRTGLMRYSTSDTLSISTLGVRFGRTSVFASFMPKVNSVVGNALVGGSLSREERDIGASYALGSGLAVSLIWKTGKVSPLVAPSAGAQLGARGEQTASGFLLGVSGTAVMDDRLSLYGNLGYGPVRWKTTEVLGPVSRNKGRYTLAEMGLAYQLLEPGDGKWFSSATLQLGYRVQLASFVDIDLPTYRLDGSIASLERAQARPITQGMTLGLSVGF